MDLLEIRGRLDQIDTQIEKLFEERMRLCSEVAEYKIATGKAVYDASSAAMSSRIIFTAT